MIGNEIVTLQFGNYANFVGCHFWNLQSKQLETLSEDDIPTSHIYHSYTEVKKDVYKYTPRTLSVDLSGTTGAFSFKEPPSFSEGANREHSLKGLAAQTWSGGFEVHEKDSEPQSRYAQLMSRRLRRHREAQWEGSHLSYGLEREGAGEPDDEDLYDEEREAEEAEAAQRLDYYKHEGSEETKGGENAMENGSEETSGVRYLTNSDPVNTWIDFNEVLSYDPEYSLYQLPGCWYGISEWAAFGDGHVAGSESISEILDRVRRLVEDCDRFQGIQILAEDLGGFGIILEEVLAETAAEYDKRPSLLYSTRRTPERDSDPGNDPSSVLKLRGTLDDLNQGLALSSLTELASFYVPLQTPLPPFTPAAASSSPGGSSTAAFPFESSAPLALVIDSLATALRGGSSISNASFSNQPPLYPSSSLASASSCPTFSSFGSASLHDLVRLLGTGGGANIAATKALICFDSSSLSNPFLAAPSPSDSSAPHALLCTPDLLLSGDDSFGKGRGHVIQGGGVSKSRYCLGRVYADEAEEGGEEGGVEEEDERKEGSRKREEGGRLKGSSYTNLLARSEFIVDRGSARAVSAEFDSNCSPSLQAALAAVSCQSSASPSHRISRHLYATFKPVELSRTFPSQSLVVRQWAQTSKICQRNLSEQEETRNNASIAGQNRLYSRSNNNSSQANNIASISTSLFATGSFKKGITAVANRFKCSSRSTYGRSRLSEWNLGDAERSEVEEKLQNLKEQYD
uniref:Misato Segment II tubulin-like domain-containing protein n=1 Tax=Polytomella parva TaxID=51329 RepID=A0A7S0UND9_9CHLO|mmetsp:Transcript_1572/g.2252  ORF Transcript_1572/g.2252 Transcript_1572/m.2252 type:complete len:742 (+) Transcript_1572:28-2253(+)|eukprot:CAMPEP_0175041356 /NCGR_PEP_ID=MMETSP0052_2-20121109/1862_1 /TAXON_ID=51329 ORGANISM="Polytomella parva, Strain SAG 63-3" /NCGR_SAMPLE_ID=MMETSP0052_2 /ASSEMBLY_ACC=CAM_ASM_000194 /LENGTH=741 /DNA_ID=CAMNT_0016303847 /DNA_START=15 /DNA_END=2240 /DNA_ORIENTATION=+